MRNEIRWDTGNVYDLSLKRILVFDFDLYLELNEYFKYIYFLKKEIDNNNTPLKAEVEGTLRAIIKFYQEFPYIDKEKEHLLIGLIINSSEITKSFIKRNKINLEDYLKQNTSNLNLVVDNLDKILGEEMTKNGYFNYEVKPTISQSNNLMILKSKLYKMKK